MIPLQSLLNGPWRRTKPRPTQRDLRASLADGAAFSLMVGCGETYLPAFALAVGMGETPAGLVATIPMLAGGLLQLITPGAVRRAGSYRAWVLATVCIQGLVFVPLAFAALAGQASAGLVFGCAALYWAAGMAAGPAWTAWMGVLVPRRIRATFFAHRTRLTQITVMIGLIGGGLLLEGAKDLGQPTRGFAWLFAAACAARLLSAAFLARQRDATPADQLERPVAPPELLRRWRHADGKLLTYMLCVQVAAYIAAPYFTPFMLKKLELGYADYVALLAASFGAKILTLPVLGRFAKEHGARRLLWIAGFGIVPLAAGWTFSTDFTYLLILQVFAGCAWACYELATFLLLYETIPDEERTAVMTLYNMGNALAIVIGSTLGGWLLHGFGETHAAYAWVFAVSSAARLVTLPLLARVRRAAVGDPSVGLQTLTVRPSDGSIDGPILPSLHHREEEALTDSPTTR